MNKYGVFTRTSLECHRCTLIYQNRSGSQDCGLHGCQGLGVYDPAETQDTSPHPSKGGVVPHHVPVDTSLHRDEHGSRSVSGSRTRESVKQNF